jgi:uncharacterized protein YecE (DUF72 family)
MKKLKDVQTATANFFASGVLKLKEKLGPILWQFPPGFAFNPERFEAFFELLPKTTRAAAALARKHDQRLEGRAWTKAQVQRPIRYAVEIRHNSFKDERFIKLLRKYRIALVLADTAGRWPYMEDITADFIYARLHGDSELYVSGYTEAALDWWAKRLRAWQCGDEPADAMKISSARGRGRRCRNRDVFVYFDNDAKVKAPFDAMNLARRMSGGGFEPLPEALRGAGEPAREHWPAVGKRTKPSAAVGQ